MISNLSFDGFILLLRVILIFLIYFFLFQVIRVIIQEIRTVGTPAVERMVEPGGHLIVKTPGHSGMRAGVRLVLEPVTVIGRHPRATIQIDDGFVSSEHAQVAWSDGAWWVTDLGSTNGTVLNGKPITVPIGMHFGDIIEIGDVQLQLAP